MAVNVENLGGLKRAITVELAADKVEKNYQDKLRTIAKDMNLKGFRPGKVPAKVVEMKVGKGVRDEVIAQLFEKAFGELAQEQDLKVAGIQDLQPSAYAKGQNVTCKAQFEVYPELDISGFAEVDVNLQECTVSDDNIQLTIDRIIKGYAEWETVERASKDSDTVVIDFVGMVDGKEFSGGSHQDFKVEIGSKSLIAGFEDGLIGALSGEKRGLELTFPENYQVAELAGKPVHFDVTVKEVQQAKLPELTDAFVAEKLDVSEGGVTAFRDQVSSNLKREIEQVLRENNKKAVFDALVKSFPIEVPDSLIAMEIQSLKKNAMQRMAGMQNMPKDQIKKMNLPDELFKANAEERVKMGLLLRAIIEKFSLKLDEDILANRVNEMAQSYQNPDEFKQFFSQNKQQHEQLQAMVLEEQVVAKVLEDCKTTKEEVPFDKLKGQK